MLKRVLVLKKGGFIMATASYSNQMSIEKKDVKRFLEILSSDKKVPSLKSSAKKATKKDIRKLFKK